jgi:hypothetical protein
MRWVGCFPGGHEVEVTGFGKYAKCVRVCGSLWEWDPGLHIFRVMLLRVKKETSASGARTQFLMWWFSLRYQGERHPYG